MRVGILTSWRVPCGVYQYSARFADALAQVPGVTPVILAGRADEHRSVPEESDHEVYDTGQIGMWRDDGEYRLDVDRIADQLDLYLVHVQYQSMLVREPDLVALAQAFNGPLAVTFHDRCQASTFPYHAFDLRFTHRQGVGLGDVIPFGVEDLPPVVRTFGLGRSQVEVIAPICERNGWVFESATSHEPIHGGGQAWRTHRDLIAWLRGADAIVWWYPPQPLAGSSQAARTAMASRRPVFTNCTEWFADLPDATRGFAKVGSEAELEQALRATFDRPYVADNSWVSVARRMCDFYRGALR